jgi:hypothetical protein
MYLCDPARGRVRRSHLRDQLDHLERASMEAISATRCDVRNRARGLYAELSGRLHDEPADDDVLADRVRAKIGRWVSHPHAIEVHAHNGTVMLAGPILAHEIAPLIGRVRAVRGVRHVENSLDPHQHADITSLTGGRPAREPLDLPWSPPVRAAATLGGVSLLGRALFVRGPLSLGLGGLGLLLAARAITNEAPHRWLKRRDRPRA